MAQAHGIGIVAHSPLGGGFLTGKYKPGQPPPPDSRFAAHPGGISSLPQHYDLMMTETNLRVVETVRTLAQVYDTTPSAIALAWVLAKPFVSSAIIGPKNPMQLEDNLAAADVTLTPEEVAQLDAVSEFAPQASYAGKCGRGIVVRNDITSFFAVLPCSVPGFELLVLARCTDSYRLKPLIGIVTVCVSAAQLGYS